MYKKLHQYILFILCAHIPSTLFGRDTSYFYFVFSQTYQNIVYNLRNKKIINATTYLSKSKHSPESLSTVNVTIRLIIGIVVSRCMACFTIPLYLITSYEEQVFYPK